MKMTLGDVFVSYAIFIDYSENTLLTHLAIKKYWFNLPKKINFAGWNFFISSAYNRNQNKNNTRVHIRIMIRLIWNCS